MKEAGSETLSFQARTRQAEPGSSIFRSKSNKRSNKLCLTRLPAVKWDQRVSQLCGRLIFDPLAIVTAILITHYSQNAEKDETSAAC